MEARTFRPGRQIVWQLLLQRVEYTHRLLSSSFFVAFFRIDNPETELLMGKLPRAFVMPRMSAGFSRSVVLRVRRLTLLAL